MTFPAIPAEETILSISFLVKYAFFGFPVEPAVVKTLKNFSSGTAKKDLGFF